MTRVDIADVLEDILVGAGNDRANEALTEAIQIMRAESVSLTDDLCSQMLREVSTARHRAYNDVLEVGGRWPQARQVSEAIAAETVRSFLYQAGVLPPEQTPEETR